MKKLLAVIIFCFIFLGCKKGHNFSSEAIPTKKVKTDTIKIEDKNQIIFINPTLSYIDSLKKSFKNKDDFYTIADDANFYMAEAGNYIIKNKIDTININNNKVLKIGKRVIILSKYKPWTLLFYKKNKGQIKNVFPVDLEKEFSNFYPINKRNFYNSIEDVLATNKFNSSNILYKNEFDFNDDGLDDYIFVLNKDENIKTLILIKNEQNNYTLSLANDQAIPCEECGNGAESFYDYKVDKDILLFSSSYKSNENIYKIDFEFKNDKEKFFLLNKVVTYRSRVGESTGNTKTLDKNTYGTVALKDFNYSDFISKYILE